jgi:hypothetical protein
MEFDELSRSVIGCAIEVHLLDCGYRINLVVAGDLIVEVKCVERFRQPIRHKSSLICV